MDWWWWWWGGGAGGLERGREGGSGSRALADRLCCCQHSLSCRTESVKAEGEC